MAIPHGFYAEVNLSASHVCQAIRHLLLYFGIKEDEMALYLREDRDA
jgi:hypothetical protein